MNQINLEATLLSKAKGNYVLDKPETTSSKLFAAELKAGDIFRAIVMDSTMSGLTLQLLDGTRSTIEAKTRHTPDARIGSEAFFLVKESLKGQILLEIIKPDMTGKDNPYIREALVSADMPYTIESAILAAELLESNIPLTPDNLQKAMFFKFYGKGLDNEKVLFLMKENFPMNEKVVENLNKFINKSYNLSENISDLITEIFVDKDLIELTVDFIKNKIVFDKEMDWDENAVEAAKKELIKPNEKDLEESIKKYFLIDLEDDDKNLNNYYKRISEFTDKILKSGTTLENVLSKTRDIKENLEFTNEINNTKEYMHIPVMINDVNENGELYIFKRDKKKNLEDAASVLLALDLATLGHIELFIEKDKKNVSFLIKSDKDTSLKAISNSFSRLAQSLGSIDIKVTGVNYKKTNEVSSITMNHTDKSEINITTKYTVDVKI